MSAVEAEFAEWRDLAGCLGFPPSLWYSDPLPGDRDPGQMSGEARRLMAARESAGKKICERCPVRVECRAEAHASREKDGTRGAETAGERRRVFRARRVRRG